jgi:hypothetical protein
MTVPVSVVVTLIEVVDVEMNVNSYVSGGSVDVSTKVDVIVDGAAFGKIVYVEVVVTVDGGTN